jgi:plastocyanin
MKANLFLFAGTVLCGWLTTVAFPQSFSAVTGRVNVVTSERSQRADNAPGVVVWLTPLSDNGTNPAGARQPARPEIVQRNKRFETRVLVVERGTVVGFPNKDPFFHNVFSFFEGKRFDLGLYEANSTKSVRFDKVGVSFIFCNIHPQMSATVVVVDTPHFTLLSSPGNFQLPQVPPGRYQLGIWAERVSAQQLKAASRQITVTDGGRVLEPIQLREDVAAVRVNKYGKAYETPVFSSPIYAQP